MGKLGEDLRMGQMGLMGHMCFGSDGRGEFWKRGQIWNHPALGKYELLRVLLKGLKNEKISLYFRRRKF
jgi:hypothetical protein